MQKRTPIVWEFLFLTQVYLFSLFIPLIRTEPIPRKNRELFSLFWRWIDERISSLLTLWCLFVFRRQDISLRLPLFFTTSRLKIPYSVQVWSSFSFLFSILSISLSHQQVCVRTQPKTRMREKPRPVKSNNNKKKVEERITRIDGNIPAIRLHTHSILPKTIPFRYLSFTSILLFTIMILLLSLHIHSFHSVS